MMQEFISFLNERFEKEDLKESHIKFYSEDDKIYLTVNGGDFAEENIKILVDISNPANVITSETEWLDQFTLFTIVNYEFFYENKEFSQNLIFPKGLKFKQTEFNLEYSLTYQNSNINNSPFKILEKIFNFDGIDNESICISQVSSDMCFYFFLSTHYPIYFYKNVLPIVNEIIFNIINSESEENNIIEMNTIFYSWAFTATYRGDNKNHQEIETKIDNCLYELSKKSLIFFRDLPNYYSKEINLEYDNLSFSVDKKYDKNLVTLYKSAMSERVPSRAYLSFYSILDYCTQGLNNKHKKVELNKIILPHKAHIIDELSKKTKDVEFFGKSYTFVKGSEIADFFYHLRNNIYHLDKNHEKKEPYIPYTKIENKIELIIPSIKMLCELLIEFKAESIN